MLGWRASRRLSSVTTRHRGDELQKRNIIQKKDERRRPRSKKDFVAGSNDLIDCNQFIHSNLERETRLARPCWSQIPESGLFGLIDVAVKKEKGLSKGSSRTSLQPFLSTTSSAVEPGDGSTSTGNTRHRNDGFSFPSASPMNFFFHSLLA